MTEKLDRVLPPLFALAWARLVPVAKECGYALAIHGSMNRDLDLVAVPWVDVAVSPKDLVQRFADEIAFLLDEEVGEPTLKPHGRLAWSIVMEIGYLDISVIPVSSANHNGDE